MRAKPLERHSCRRRASRVAPLACALVAMASTGAANAEVCTRAAMQAANETGVPYAVLMAITLTETGRTRAGETEPWPWTINIEGEGYWFDTQDAALAFAYQALRDGRTSFDTGCFQINYRWHGENFSSLEAMFDPVQNATYAALFLADLYAESGDWSVAAGAYHSRTEVYASRYRARFDTFYAAAQSERPPVLTGGPMVAVAQVRVNTFPLLQAGGARATAPLGSLMPAAQGN